MKIICIELNYKTEIEALKLILPDNPVFYLKADSSILKNNKDFWLPTFSDDIQPSIEIIFKIGKLGKCIQAKFAHRYIDSIGLGIALTARDLQKTCMNKGLPWEISKSFDGSAIISEFIPYESFTNINNINFSLYKNEKLIQRSNTSDMIFNIFQIIEYISKFMTLKIGDIIFTGTPSEVEKLNIGDNLTAFLENTKMIDMKIL